MVTNNEITATNPNGIAIDVSAKRLKRIMTGCCYDGGTDFEWVKKNAPYNDDLAVYEIAEVDKSALDEKGENIFTAIDERNYALDAQSYDLDENGRFKFAHDKALWIADKFALTLTQLETNAEYLARHGIKCKPQELQKQNLQNQNSQTNEPQNKNSQNNNLQQNSQNKPQAKPQDSKGSEQ